MTELESTIQTWLVQVQEWNGVEYVPRIVGAFPNEDEAEVWAERHRDLAPSVFDAMQPDDADNYFDHQSSSPLESSHPTPAPIGGCSAIDLDSDAFGKDEKS